MILIIIIMIFILGIVIAILTNTEAYDKGVQKERERWARHLYKDLQEYERCLKEPDWKKKE